MSSNSRVDRVMLCLESTLRFMSALLLVSDIDECTNQHSCYANSVCNNTVGRYMCVCNDGFILNNDQRNCEGI